MENEQLVKRVQWLEEERRRERDAVAIMENRLANMENIISVLTKQIKDMGGDVTRLGQVVTRMDQYDGNLAQARLESRQALEIIEKETRKREEEMEKVRRVEYKAHEVNLVEIRKSLDVIPRLEHNLGLRLQEEAAIRRMIDETRQRIEQLRHDEEEYTRTYRLLDDGRRQDAKRITDLQGEVAALRKRADEQRGQIEVSTNNFKKLDTRLNELIAVESERRDAMSSFMDKQMLAQVERDRTWKEWELRFSTIEQEAQDVESKLLALDAVQRDAKRIQTVIEELAVRVDRRVNEISEIQRLAEDRFRQEWVTFKADDQKRWTNYTLTQDEQRSEIQRQASRLAERTTSLEDSLQRLSDILDQANQETARRLHALLTQVHEWVNTFERTVGGSK
jgi:DNA repair exonuclease SbcCD ATPase subunit